MSNAVVDVLGNARIIRLKQVYHCLRSPVRFSIGLRGRDSRRINPSGNQAVSVGIITK